jgi:hypothetical protein
VGIGIPEGTTAMSAPKEASAEELAWARAWAAFDEANPFPGVSGGLLQRAHRAAERRSAIPFYPSFPSLDETLEAPVRGTEGPAAEARS